MSAGAMRERITIQAPAATDDSYGDSLPTFTDLVTVWAQKVEKTGREIFQSGQVAADQLIIFRTRYLDGFTITAKHRVIWRNRTLDITEPPVNTDNHRRTLELRCTEHG